MSKQLFFELIQIAIGQRNCLSVMPTKVEWRGLYAEAIRQSVVGLLLSGAERIHKQNPAMRPPMAMLYEWVGSVAQIEQKNRELNSAAAQLHSIFKSGGLRSCVLKGQGLASFYPKPQRRQPGDIDLWVEGKRKNTLNFLKKNYLGTGRMVIHHVDARIVEGVESEIHFLPIWMYNPWHNWQLQRYFKAKKDEQFAHYDPRLGFCHPTAAFNAVYVLMHNFHHLLDEGLGLRQVIDYYFVLKQLNDTERKTAMKAITKIGGKRFAGAMMYVLEEVCALERPMMPCEPDTIRGKRLLKEIMLTGNFGQFDERFDKSANESPYKRNKRKATRWLQLLKDYPAEVLCIPCWKLWHWCWRKYHGYV